MKKFIVAEPDFFIDRNENLPNLLRRLKVKKLFKNFRQLRLG
jgi:hypothetical protein